MRSVARIDRRRLAALLLLAASALALSGCTNLFFLPMKRQVLSPQQMGLPAEDLYLSSGDGTRLFAWRLFAEEPRGVVCYFHGNAENISTHIVNVAWLPARHYEVLLTDYRGYGGSSGDPTLEGALLDVQAGLDACRVRGEALGVPVHALGQSLGAALVLEVASRPENRAWLASVTVDSGFTAYRKIARDALQRTWVGRLLAPPLGLLVTSAHAPADAIGKLPPVPVLVLHSPDDEIIPYAHGEALYAAARSPKSFLSTRGPHNGALRLADVQDALVSFMAQAPVRDASR